MPELTLYSRSGCHLCEDMHQQLVAYQETLGFRLKALDIDADSALVAKYGELVPVLKLKEREVCHYFLDLDALKTCLATC